MIIDHRSIIQNTEFCQIANVIFIENNHYLTLMSYEIITKENFINFNLGRYKIDVTNYVQMGVCKDLELIKYETDLQSKYNNFKSLNIINLNTEEYNQYIYNRFNICTEELNIYVNIINDSYVICNEIMCNIKDKDLYYEVYSLDDSIVVYHDSTDKNHINNLYTFLKYMKFGSILDPKYISVNFIISKINNTVNYNVQEK